MMIYQFGRDDDVYGTATIGENGEVTISPTQGMENECSLFQTASQHELLEILTHLEKRDRGFGLWSSRTE